MTNNKKTNPLEYSLKFTAFCLLCALLTVILIMITNKIQERNTAANSDSVQPITVVIDAGHGGEDGGTSGLYAVEKDVNLSISALLCDMLRNDGINVKMTRTEDILLYDRNVDYHGRKKALDLSKRLEMTNQTENPIFISIHMNSFPQSKYRGLQVYYSQNDPNSKRLADMIQSNTKDQLQPDNNRVTKGATSSIYLLHNLQVPAVLVECGFLSNPEECKLLSTEEYQKELATVIFYSIKEYISANGT